MKLRKDIIEQGIMIARMFRVLEKSDPDDEEDCKKIICVHCKNIDKMHRRYKKGQICECGQAIVDRGKCGTCINPDMKPLGLEQFLEGLSNFASGCETGIGLPKNYDKNDRKEGDFRFWRKFNPERRLGRCAAVRGHQ